MHLYFSLQRDNIGNMHCIKDKILHCCISLFISRVGSNPRKKVIKVQIDAHKLLNLHGSTLDFVHFKGLSLVWSRQM